MDQKGETQHQFQDGYPVEGNQRYFTALVATKISSAGMPTKMFITDTPVLWGPGEEAVSRPSGTEGSWERETRLALRR